MARHAIEKNIPDKGILCWCARRAEDLFNFIDRRQVIRRAAFVWILWLNGTVMAWTMDYAWHVNMEGGQIAMVIGAIWGPLAVLTGAVIKFYDQAQVQRQASETNVPN